LLKFAPGRESFFTISSL